jgi:hypothetical protein
MRIRTLLLIKVMRICGPPGLHFEPPRPSTAVPIKLLNIFPLMLLIRIQLPKIMRIRARNPAG